MPYQKLQVSQALPVIVSDTVHIPDPTTEVLTGTADFTGSTLVDVGTTFLTAGIQLNAIVYNAYGCSKRRARDSFGKRH